MFCKNLGAIQKCPKIIFISIVAIYKFEDLGLEEEEKNSSNWDNDQRITKHNCYRRLKSTEKSDCLSLQTSYQIAGNCWKCWGYQEKDSIAMNDKIMICLVSLKL